MIWITRSNILKGTYALHIAVLGINVHTNVGYFDFFNPTVSAESRYPTITKAYIRTRNSLLANIYKCGLIN